MASLDRMWGAAYQSIVRIAALTVGQLATATERLDPVSRAALLTRVETLAARAEQVGAATAEPDESGGLGWRPGPGPSGCCVPNGSGSRGGSAPSTDRSRGRSSARGSRAWPPSSGTAMRSRRRAPGLGSRTPSGPPVTAPEPARAWAAAREVAARLGALPLIAELDALVPAGTDLGSGEALTGREAQVLDLVARGLTNGQIGLRLHISTKTVSVHVSRVLARLGAAGRTEAAPSRTLAACSTDPPPQRLARQRGGTNQLPAPPLQAPQRSRRQVTPTSGR